MGMHGGYGGHEAGRPRAVRVTGERRLNRPAAEAGTYAAIEMTAAPDPATLPGLTTKLTESLSAFNGRIIANDTNPSPWTALRPQASS
ncbi:hypothetical protein PY365_15945 [Roseiarcaceae bacterium H3SJ34-1]|uniref:hypothetical protein n=1 Tax=Terripilifer ovatus TaxID=3032367 RepID=UPI003AB9891E|nr:hypothetical protein [Roseiarcaceae bacterium H3SJ34-1]